MNFVIMIIRSKSPDIIVQCILYKNIHTSYYTAFWNPNTLLLFYRASR